MKNRRVQFVTVVMLACVMMLCIPGTVAKFSKTDIYKVGIKVKGEKVPDTYSNVYSAIPNGSDTHKITKAGKYIIILKGGNGGDGYKQSGGSVAARISGGNGGIVAGVGYFEKDELLTIYLGTAGGDAAPGCGSILSTYYPGYSTYSQPSKKNQDKRSTFVGTAGTNASGVGLGVEGNYVKFDVATGNDDVAAKQLYVVSAGSGAASRVSSNKGKLIVAGGGGAAASYDSGVSGLSWTTAEAKPGGAGGSNYNTGTSGVIDGLNGSGSDGSGYKTYGTGGTSSGGAKGYDKKNIIFGRIAGRNPLVDCEAGDGGDSGTGKGGFGVYNGGPGGGGYCGGGGGAGLGIDGRYAGGGGGGSSYVGGGLTWSVANNSDYNANISTYNLESDNGNGWVIIAYLSES